MGEFMRVNGTMTSVMGEDLRSTQMVIYTKVNFNLEKPMAKVVITGCSQMKCMMESGPRESDMAMGCGRRLTRRGGKQTRMWENGKRERLMDMGCTHGTMGIGMRENGNSV
jgi:hypothetical protein